MQSGQPDMSALMEQAQQMQKQMMAAQRELAAAEIQGEAPGGLVSATVNGSGDIRAISINPEVIDNADPRETAETIADLVHEAVSAAQGRANEYATEKLGPLSAM